LYQKLSEYTNSENEELKEINNKILEKIFHNRLDEKDVLYKIQENLTDDGLILVYRAITFNNKGDIFSELKKDYQGVGIYWSY
jgi:ribosomal protein L18E